MHFHRKQSYQFLWNGNGTGKNTEKTTTIAEQIWKLPLHFQRHSAKLISLNKCECEYNKIIIVCELRACVSIVLFSLSDVVGHMKMNLYGVIPTNCGTYSTLLIIIV